MQGIGAEHPAAPQALELQYKINYSAVLGGPFHLKLSAYDLTCKRQKQIIKKVKHG